MSPGLGVAIRRVSHGRYDWLGLPGQIGKGLCGQRNPYLCGTLKMVAYLA